MILIINGEEKNRSNWKFGVISQLHQGKDKVVRAVQVRVAGIFLGIKLLYLLELHCAVQNRDVEQPERTNLNVNANEFRFRRTAERIAKLEVKDTAEKDDELRDI